MEDQLVWVSRTGRKTAMLAGVFLSGCFELGAFAYAQEFPADLPDEPDPELIRFLAERAYLSSVELNFNRVVGAILIPVYGGPQNIDELAEGAYIGAVYLPSGSHRFDLDTGVYSVFVKRGDAESWSATLSTESGESVIALPAAVRSYEEINEPTPYVEYSWCWRLDHVLVCI